MGIRTIQKGALAGAVLGILALSACGTALNTSGTGGNGGEAGSGGAGGHEGTGGAASARSGHPGAALVSAAVTGESESYRMIYVLGQSSQNQTKTTSESFRQRGGVLGATGSEK